MSQVRIPEHVVFRPFGAEIVLLNLQTGQYHGLNHTGGRMLEVLAEVGDMDVAAGRISAEFSRPIEEITKDMSELCNSLVERSLVEIDPDPGGGSRPADGTTGNGDG